VTGNPAPTVLWYRKSVLVGAGEHHRVENVSRQETDSYQCLADNGVGHPASCHASLTVECKSSLLADHFSRPHRAVGPVRVSLCVSLYWHNNV